MATANKCGAPITGGRTCRRPAGWQTSHPGVGTCCTHSLVAIAPRESVSQLSKYLDPQIAPRVLEILKDPDLLNLREELAICRAMLENLKLDDKGMHVFKAEKLAHVIGYLADRIHEIEQGRQHFLHISVTGEIVQAFIEIGKEYIPDPHDRYKFSNRIKDVLQHAIKKGNVENIAISALSGNLLDAPNPDGHNGNSY